MDPLIKREVISSLMINLRMELIRSKNGVLVINKDFAEETAKFFREEKNNLDLVAVGDYLGKRANI